MNISASTVFKCDNGATRILSEVFAVPIAVALMMTYMAFCLAVAIVLTFWTAILMILPFTLFNGEEWQTLIVPSYLTIWAVWRQSDTILYWLHKKVRF